MPIQAPQWTEFLSCPICCNVFNEKLQRPISLACGHTICKLCLAQLQQKKCPFDQTTIGRKINELPVNFALLQLVGVAASERAESREIAAHLVKENSIYYDIAKHCIEDMAIYLKPISPSSGVRVCPSDPSLASPNSLLSRPMQRKLVALVNCQLIEEEGRSRALRAARSLGERTVTELILQHQNPQQLSANLWAAVRTRGCQFLGPAMQEEVLKLILLALEDGSALSRKVLVLFVVQRLEAQYPQASKTAIGHVVQLLYRASCFKVTKREKESSLMQLKEEFCNYESLRREHDSQIVQIATEAGLRISPEQWSSLLYGDIAHKSHMQSIIDKLQTPQSFTQSIDELAIVLQRTTDPYGIAKLRAHFDLLANVDPNQEAPPPTWDVLAEVMQAVQVSLDGLVQFIQKRSHRKTETLIPQNPKFKTSMCRDLLHKGRCPRADTCTFAHSQDELERYRANSRRMGKTWSDAPAPETASTTWKGSNAPTSEAKSTPADVHHTMDEKPGGQSHAQPPALNKHNTEHVLPNATYGSDTLSTATPPSYSSPASQGMPLLPDTHTRSIADPVIYQHLTKSMPSGLYANKSISTRSCGVSNSLTSAKDSSRLYRSHSSPVSSSRVYSSHSTDMSSSRIHNSLSSNSVSGFNTSQSMPSAGMNAAQSSSLNASPAFSGQADTSVAEMYRNWPGSAGSYDSTSVGKSLTEVTYTNRGGPLSSADSGYEAYLSSSAAATSASEELCTTPLMAVNYGNASLRASLLKAISGSMAEFARSCQPTNTGVYVPVVKPYILPPGVKTNISKQMIYTSPTPGADERKALREPIAHPKATASLVKPGCTYIPASYSSSSMTDSTVEDTSFDHHAHEKDLLTPPGASGADPEGESPTSSVKMLPNPSSVNIDKFKMPTVDSHYYLSSNIHLATRGMLARQQVGELHQRRKELLVQLSQTKAKKLRAEEQELHKDPPPTSIQNSAPYSVNYGSTYDAERFLVHPTDNYRAENFDVQLETILRRQSGLNNFMDSQESLMEESAASNLSVASTSGRFDDVMDMRGFYELQMASQAQEQEVSRWDDTGDEFVPLEHTLIPKYGPISRIVRTKMKNTSPVQVTAALERRDVTAVTAVTPVYRPYPLAKQVPSQYMSYSSEDTPVAGHYSMSDHVADPNGAHVATSLPTALIQPHVMVAGKPSEPSMLWVLKEQMMSVKNNDPIRMASFDHMQQEISQLNIQIESLKLSEDVRMIRELHAIELSIKEKERHIQIGSNGVLKNGDNADQPSSSGRSGSNPVR